MTLGSRIGILLLALAALFLPAEGTWAQGVPDGCPAALGTADIIRHDLSVSFCELCDVGSVRIEIQNPFQPWNRVDFSEIVVTEDLMDSGLTYVEGSTDFSGSNITVPADAEPTPSGPGVSVMTWTLPSDFIMEARPGCSSNRATLIIEF